MSRYLDPYDPLLAGSIDRTDTVPHDRAVARAMDSAGKYRPVEYPCPEGEGAVRSAGGGGNPKRITKHARKTLVVARLSPRTTETTLKENLSRYGRIRECRLVRDLVTGASRMYAFVEFERRSEAEDCYAGAHGAVIDEKKVLVDWEFGRTLKNWIPRRLGGGFGGRKESGQLRFGCRDRPHRRPLPPPTSVASSSAVFVSSPTASSSSSHPTFRHRR